MKFRYKIISLFFIVWFVAFVFAASPESNTIPDQLFDIKMELEETVLENSGELTAVITFESFGRVATPVDLKYSVYDLESNLLYEKEGYIVVEVEEVIREKFGDLILEPGNYRFVFTTIYNVDVQDEFIREFTVEDNMRMSLSPVLWIIFGVILILIIIFFFYLNKKQR